MRSLYRFTLFILVAGCWFSACRKPTSANWDVDLVVPVAKSTLSFKNFLGDTVFKTDKSGQLYFNINREIAALKLDSLVTLPDTTFDISLTNTLITTTLLHGSEYTYPLDDIIFDIPNGVMLGQVIIRGGALKVDFSNDLTEALDLTYSLPTVLKDGLPFTMAVTIPPGPKSLHKEFDMSGYQFNLRGLSGKTYNALGQTFRMMLSPTSNTCLLPVGKGARMEIGYTKIIPEFVEGNFGTQKIDIAPSTVTFQLIDNVRAENFMLSEANMDFMVRNEFGADFAANFSNIQSVNSVENKTVTLSSSQLTDIHLNAATRNRFENKPDVQHRVFNNGNSNITAFISNLPDKLNYAGTVELNPVLTSFSNYAFYATGLRIFANINIPLRFTANRFILKSKAAVDFSNLDQLEHVNNGRIVLTAVNSYPFDAELQAYMLDGYNQVIDSLFAGSNNRIAKPQLDGNNDVVAPSSSELYIPIDRDKADHLKRCKSLQIISKFVLPPNPPEIKIRESSQLELKIIAELSYNVGN
jgi:hypothetical protein